MAHAATKIVTLANLAIRISSNCLNQLPEPVLPQPPSGRILQARRPIRTVKISFAAEPSRLAAGRKSPASRDLPIGEGARRHTRLSADLLFCRGTESPFW